LNKVSLDCLFIKHPALWPGTENGIQNPLLAAKEKARQESLKGFSNQHLQLTAHKISLTEKNLSPTTVFNKDIIWTNMYHLKLSVITVYHDAMLVGMCQHMKLNFLPPTPR
jgi:hypothetical protein